MASVNAERAANFLPSPLEGEGGERGSDSAREPGEGSLHRRLLRSEPLTRLAFARHPLPQEPALGLAEGKTRGGEGTRGTFIDLYQAFLAAAAPKPAILPNTAPDISPVPPG